MKHFLGLSLLALVACNSNNMTEEKDPYLYLEEVEGEKALEWVKSHNDATLKSLEEEPTFAADFEKAKQVRNSKDRIIYPAVKGDYVYNFWKDEQNPRGLYRRMHQDDYNNGSKEWEIIIDIDALAEKEGKKWVFHGCKTLKPDHKLGMMALSDGGTDANEIREFNMETKEFVEGGFFMPAAKGSISWLNEDELLVQTDFGPGSMTTSGYPSMVKLWKRGQSLDEATLELQGDSTDMGLWAGAFFDGDNKHVYAIQMPDFYTAILHFKRGDKWEILDVPNSADIHGIMNHQALLMLKEDWTVEERTFKAGSLVSFDIDEYFDGNHHVELVFEPTAQQSIEQVKKTKDLLVLNILDNVKGKIMEFSNEHGHWHGKEIDHPQNATIHVAVTNEDNNRYYYTAESFTSPRTLYACENGKSTVDQAMSVEFDASDLEVKQEWASSKDGEKIPYFIVHKKGMELNGQNPTIQYAYGGFEISMKPFYSGVLGSAWLEQGGVYVIANIRGGGEFGPRWHQAALKSNRQRGYDDFHAVAEKIIGDGVTSSDHLAIHGGSNGGLLMGVMTTQRPDLYKAVICAVPLLDMKRYNKLLAGASWMGEFGNPDTDDWEFIKKYSPYHNLKEDVDYPEIIFVTSTKDDRVHPGHARKMAAKMEGMGYKIHYYENMEGGHGAASTNDQIAYRDAIQYSFLKRFVF